MIIMINGERLGTLQKMSDSGMTVQYIWLVMMTKNFLNILHLVSIDNFFAVTINANATKSQNFVIIGNGINHKIFSKLQSLAHFKSH